MNDILIMALLNRIKAGQMEVEQTPVPLQEAVQEKLVELSAN